LLAITLRRLHATERQSLERKIPCYRRRLVAKGRRQLIIDLPRETVAFIDELKERHGLRNRSQVLMQLIEKGRAVTQQQAT
jgi:hypothetical protein